MENLEVAANKFVKKGRASFSYTAIRTLVQGTFELNNSGVRISLPAPFFLASDYMLGADYLDTITSIINNNKLQSVYYLGSNTTSDGKSILLTYANQTSITPSSIVETITLGVLGLNKSYATLLNGSNSCNGTLEKPTLTISSPLQKEFFETNHYTLVKKDFSEIEIDTFLPNNSRTEMFTNPCTIKLKSDFIIDEMHGFCFQMTPNYTQGKTIQSNGQSWMLMANCFSNDWHKVTSNNN